jgi:major type 1 subunit fimbrin (pilin)
MNKKIAVTLAALGFLGAASSAFASDGTITINGKVIDATCVVSVSGASTSGTATVTLPTVSKSVLSTAGSTAGQTLLQLNLTGCPTSGAARAFFESTNVDLGTGFLINKATTPAQNVQVQVLNNTTSTPLDLRDGGNANNAYVTFDASGNAQLPYALRYVANGVSTAGNVQTQLVYSIQYQ